jgi:hypothetical protein
MGPLKKKKLVRLCSIMPQPKENTIISGVEVNSGAPIIKSHTPLCTQPFIANP